MTMFSCCIHTICCEWFGCYTLVPVSCRLPFFYHLCRELCITCLPKNCNITYILHAIVWRNRAYSTHVRWCGDIDEIYFISMYAFRRFSLASALLIFVIKLLLRSLAKSDIWKRQLNYIYHELSSVIATVNVKCTFAFVHSCMRLARMRHT